MTKFSSTFLIVVFGIFMLTSVQSFSETATSAIPTELIDVRYKKCPVLGNPVQENVTLLKDGKVYHFCCPSCIDAFSKDFDNLVKKIENPKEVPLKITNIDGKCPATGEPAVSDIFVIKGDTITFYCCKACLSSQSESIKTDMPKTDDKKVPVQTPDTGIKPDHQGHNH